VQPARTSGPGCALWAICLPLGLQAVAAWFPPPRVPPRVLADAGARATRTLQACSAPVARSVTARTTPLPPLPSSRPKAYWREGSGGPGWVEGRSMVLAAARGRAAQRPRGAPARSSTRPAADATAPPHAAPHLGLDVAVVAKLHNVAHEALGRRRVGQRGRRRAAAHAQHAGAAGARRSAAAAAAADGLRPGAGPAAHHEPLRGGGAAGRRGTAGQGGRAGEARGGGDEGPAAA
jgi:hypothetical protein